MLDHQYRVVEQAGPPALIEGSQGYRWHKRVAARRSADYLYWSPRLRR